jgi:hypothetical protein
MKMNIKNVKKFLFYHEGIIFLTGEIDHRNVFYWNNGVPELLIENEVIPSFKECKKNIILYSPNKSMLIDKKLQIVKFEKYIIEIIFNNKTYVGYKVENDDEE